MAIIDPVIHSHGKLHHWILRADNQITCASSPPSSTLSSVSSSLSVRLTIVCIGSRYLDQVGQEPQLILHNQIHLQIVAMAQDHLMWSFAEAICTVDVVQAIVAFTLWKEPEDNKAPFYFNRVGWN